MGLNDLKTQRHWPSILAAIVLDSVTEHMTVEQFLKHQLSVMEEKARVGRLLLFWAVYFVAS